MMTVPVRKRASIRTAMRALEDAVEELHALEEKACGRPAHPASIERARTLYSEAREQIEGLASWGRAADARRVRALIDTVGLLLALREACGEGSIATRVLN